MTHGIKEDTLDVLKPGYYHTIISLYFFQALFISSRFKAHVPSIATALHAFRTFMWHCNRLDIFMFHKLIKMPFGSDREGCKFAGACLL